MLSIPAPLRYRLPPLSGTNSITTPEITRNQDGQWFISFEYFYTGAPAGAGIRVELVKKPDPKFPLTAVVNGREFDAQRGRHRISREILNPGFADATVTTGVKVRLIRYQPLPPTDIVAQEIPVEINWPDFETAKMLGELRTKAPEEFMKEAIDLIDVGDEASLGQARGRLDHLLQKYPQFHPAYLELARVAMKSNWGPTGLRQAEAYIDSARQIAPEDPNAWILQGYVYAYQGRYKEAEPLFVAASKTDTHNLWLWTNWGELFNLQGKTAQAIQMFQKAIDQPPPGNTYDRARRHAYWQLLGIFKKQKKSDQVEALYKQRFQDYGSVACYGVEYARFLLMERGNAAAAIELANQPALAQCSDPDTKEVLGLAHYVTWAAAPAAERPELLNRARVYFPSGTRLIYSLATSDRSVGALKELLAAGESIDQIDNRKMTALAYALSSKDHDTAVRLLKLHGRPDFQVGDAGLPVALIPVIGEDYLGIRLMRQFGINYANIKYQNSTAFDHAKQTGNRKLLEALGTPAIEQRL